MIDAAGEELGRRVGELLQREGLLNAGESPASTQGLQTLSTPRRLAVFAPGIPVAQADVEEQVTGPAVKAAFKDGQPTVAAQKFAEKVGLPLEKIERVSTPKGEYLSAQVRRKGRTATEILAEALPKEIAGLYWAKSMYWRPGRTSERFVRPVRWLVAMLDGEVVPLEFAGLRAGAGSRGHRLLADRAIRYERAAAFAEKLREAKVLGSPEREQVIRKALDAATRTIPGARWREDAPLLNKVVNLTEWPSVLLGGFEREYLSLPEEVLVTVMRDHQNYFAIEDASGKLTPNFLAVLNTDGDPQGIIRHGHERVLRARFNDARFFWTTDQKIPLRERVEMLKAVTFQKDLGSYHAKTQRVGKLADELAAELEKTGVPLDRAALREAALLAKTDLTTELVKEFTELQGIVGGLYARHQKLGEKVAAAIYDHYKPESMEDEVPRTIEGAVLSIADKADSIAGMFALGLIPSGSKDPFALRRQANGIVKIIAEKGLRVSLRELFRNPSDNFPWKNPAEKQTSIGAFFRERLEFYLREARGFAYDVVNAVLAAGSDDVMDAVARAEALAKVRGSEDFSSISVAFKRIKNILRQANESGKRVNEKVDPALFAEDAERELNAVLSKVGPHVTELAKSRKYDEALAAMAAIRRPVDAFFDKVMVMAEDERVRGNRLAFLQGVLNSFSAIADFSEIVAEK